MEEKEELRGYFTRREETRGTEPLKAMPGGEAESDRELVHRTQKGDQGVLSALYARYRRRVLNYA